MSLEQEAYTLEAGEGKSFWFMRSLITFKTVDENSNVSYELHEHLVTPGAETPAHIHHTQDESFYLLEGTLTLHCGDCVWQVRPGSFAFLPRDIVHWFTIEGATSAKMLVITSPALTAGFATFVRELGVLSQGRDPLPYERPDQAKLLKLASTCGIEIVLPHHIEKK